MGCRLTHFRIPSDHAPIGLRICPDDNYFHIVKCRRSSAADENNWNVWEMAVKEQVTNHWTIDSNFQDITRRPQSIANIGRGRNMTAKCTSTTEHYLDIAIQSTIDGDATATTTYEVRQPRPHSARKATLTMATCATTTTDTR